MRDLDTARRGMSKGIGEGLAKIAARGDGDFAAGLVAEMRDMAAEISPQVARLRQEMPLTEPEARKAVLNVMGKGFSAKDGTDAVLKEVRRLKSCGLAFDADRIARFPRRAA